MPPIVLIVIAVVQLSFQSPVMLDAQAIKNGKDRLGAGRIEFLVGDLFGSAQQRTSRECKFHRAIMPIPIHDHQSYLPRVYRHFGHTKSVGKLPR